MKKTFIADFKPGQQLSTTLLLQSKERKVARNGSAYMDLELRDASGVLRAKLWDSDRVTSPFEADDIVQVVGALELFQGAPQLNVREIHRFTQGEPDMLDYLPRTRQNPEKMYAALLNRVNGLDDGPVKTLLLAVLQDPEIACKYQLAPAATAMHHAFLGGLLEHVTSLCELADYLCSHYAWLDRSLMLAGIVLHDIGKIEELSFNRSFRYSTRGQLLGHIMIGIGMVQEKMRALPDFPPHVKDQVEHMILSHHGKPEFGSPKEPMFAEALAVHALDDLDSKMESIRAQYEVEKDLSGDWTSRNLSLGRKLLKNLSD